MTGALTAASLSSVSLGSLISFSSDTSMVGVVAVVVVAVVVVAADGGIVDNSVSGGAAADDDDELHASNPSPTDDVVTNGSTAEGVAIIIGVVEGRSGVDTGAIGTGTPMSDESVLSADAIICGSSGHDLTEPSLPPLNNTIDVDSANDFVDVVVVVVVVAVFAKEVMDVFPSTSGPPFMVPPFMVPTFMVPTFMAVIHQICEE